MIEFSSMTETERQAIRSVLNKFGGAGIEHIKLYRIVEVISKEARRYFAKQYTPGKIVVTGKQLDLTIPQVLREKDSFLNYDPDGGYIEFSETTHDDKGEVVTDDLKVYQRKKQFNSGSIQNYTYSETLDTPNGNTMVAMTKEGLKVSSNIEYVETAWNQQISYVESNGIKHNETYNYQSQPLRKITLTAGDEYYLSASAIDQIIDSHGWNIITEGSLNGKFTGTLTLYKPKETNAEENANPEQKQTKTEEPLGNAMKYTTTETTVTESKNAVGKNSELEETVKIVTTTTSTEIVETGSGSRDPPFTRRVGRDPPFARRVGQDPLVTRGTGRDPHLQKTLSYETLSTFISLYFHP
jgi:hypothetical protein